MADRTRRDVERAEVEALWEQSQRLKERAGRAQDNGIADGLLDRAEELMREYWEKREAYERRWGVQ